ncbi:MAG: DUF4249 family protein [Haliscomenobacteraceae bacterium CHB4]|nr:DUF4249 family protein [Haliscomenobacteraceae bacterium CHB4]
MKKLLFLLPLWMLFLAACSNDFDVAAPWKEIPVAYGILSPADSAHYIRVEKAFLDPETSALVIAQIPDSIYYPENAIAVYLQRVNGGQLYQMHRVNGAAEGYPRKDGIFASQPNWLYKIKPDELDSLKKGEKYRLVIKRADGKPDVTAETSIPKDFIFRDPSPLDNPLVMGFLPDLPTYIEWRGDENGVYYNVNLVIRYRENYPDGSVVHDTVVWQAAKNIQRTDVPVAGGLYKGQVSLPGESFYRFLNENIASGANPPERRFVGIDFVLTGGGKEIRDYLETAAANSGITGAEVFPNYTNLSEGFGLFSAKNTNILNDIRLTNKTVEEVQKNPLTSHLNFRF